MKKIIGFAVGFGLLAVPFMSLADSTVTATAGIGASVSPSGVTVVPTGDTQVFSFGVLQGYQLSNVSVDGINEGAIGSYSLMGDLLDHAITASAASSGSLMPYCSGPMAPGWQQGIAGGGCGGTGVTIPAGAPGCPYFMASGCIKE